MIYEFYLEDTIETSLLSALNFLVSHGIDWRDIEIIPLPDNAYKILYKADKKLLEI